MSNMRKERLGINNCVTVGTVFNGVAFIFITFLGHVNLGLSVTLLFVNFVTFEFTIVTAFTVWMKTEPDMKGAMMSLGTSFIWSENTELEQDLLH